MKQKPVTPYARLLASFREFAGAVEYRHRKFMWLYPKAKLNGSWRLDDLWERTAAAEQIGYDVVLRAKDDGLHVEYIKKVPERPWEARYP